MPVHTVLLLAGAALLFAATARVVFVLFRYQGARVVTCPESHRTAGVALDARRLLSTGLIATPKLRLATCSRWPEKAGCGQDCLSQIEAGPANCLVRTLLAEWYADKKCVYCGQPFGDIRWDSQKPAFLVKGSLFDTNQVPAERLPEILAEARPVCFACHTANSWVRDHADTVTDRSMQKREE